MPIVYHIPAMLAETIEGLAIRPDGIYVDVTFGGGGHSRAILSHLTTGRLFSFDQDMDAYENAMRDPFWQEAEQSGRWVFVHGNFRYLSNFLEYYTAQGLLDGQVDGILADLGVSFHHFDEAERGFSFRFSGPLDMRMNRLATTTAADILNTATEERLASIFLLYGELKNARQLARRIAQARMSAPFERTEQLVDVLTAGHFTSHDGEIEVEPFYKKDLAPIFQALRIEVNDELGALPEMLNAGLSRLRPDGRFAVLTYHSLEDRMVKNFFRTGNMEGRVEKDFYGNQLSPFTAKSGKALVASAEEVASNPRSRSAKLRVAIKKSIG